MALNSAAIVTDPTTSVTGGRFVQYIADNVDHNIQTLDGHGAFHGMGMVAAIAPAQSTPIVVPRKNVATKYILDSGHIAIHQYNYPINTSPATFNDLVELWSKIKVLPHLITTDQYFMEVVAVLEVA